MNERIYKHQCKDCDTRFYIEDLKLVSASTCPKCKGESIYVDEHKIEQDNKYNQNSFDAFIHAVQTCGIDFTSSKDKTSLLVIELQDESSVPKVIYKGKEIRLKQNVYFDWDTDTEVMGGLTYAIEHAVTDEGYVVINKIERRVKGHAT